MPAITDIKYHIRSVKQTRQITNAMYLISASRMRRAVKRIEQNKAYFDHAAQTVRDIVAHSGSDAVHPYLQKREGKNAAFLVIAGNKGLAGSYNHDVLGLAEKSIRAVNAKKIFAVGDVAANTLKKHGFIVDDSLVHMGDNPSIAQARKLASTITAMYDAEEIDEFHVVYTRFFNSLHREPADMVLLPVELCSLMNECKIPSPESFSMLYDPSPEEVLNVLVPQLVVGYVYGALVHANASENSARMTAMENATSSADDMIEKLTVQYNGMRQLNITNELAEIVGGSTTFREKG